MGEVDADVGLRAQDLIAGSGDLHSCDVNSPGDGPKVLPRMERIDGRNEFKVGVGVHRPAHFGAHSSRCSKNYNTHV